MMQKHVCSVKMWTGPCEVFKCCNDHKVKFCGLCNEFPCKWLKEKVAEWPEASVEAMQRLAEKYKTQNVEE